MSLFSLVSNESSHCSAPQLDGGLSKLFDDLAAEPDESIPEAPHSLKEALFSRIDQEPARVRTDENGLITATNPAFSRLCGYSYSEIRGKKPGSFLHGPLTESDVVDEIRQALAAREPVRVELTNYHKDGSPYRVQIFISPRYIEGQFVGYDAEERKLS